MSATVARKLRSWASLDDEVTMSGPGDTNESFSPATEVVRTDPRNATPPAGSDDARYAVVRADVEARLRKVCAGMSAELFAELVHDICSKKLRWARDEDTPES